MIYYCLWSKNVFYNEIEKGYSGDLTKAPFFDITDNRNEFFNKIRDIKSDAEINNFLSGVLSSYVKRRASVCHGEDYLMEYYIDWLEYTKRYTKDVAPLKVVYDWCIDYENYINEHPELYR